jgi:iron complex outermembrane receptor protein
VVRGKVLWQPAPNVEVYVIGDVQDHLDGGVGGLATVRNIAGSSAAGYPTNPASTYNVDFNALLAAEGITAGPNNTSYAHNSLDQVYIKQHDVQANIKVGLGDFTLNSITAYGHVKSGSWFDQDYTQTNFYDINNSVLTSRQISQEFRINSPTGHFVDYVAGLYFYDMNTSAYERSAGTRGQTLPANTLYSYSGAMLNYGAHNTSYAAFGEANFHLTHKLTAIGGLRFTYDRAHANYFPSADIAYTFTGPTPAAPVAATKTASNLSGKATLKWDVSDTFMTYATYSRGYKAPAVGVASGVLRPIEHESVDNFELGARLSLFDRKVVLNATLFHEKFKNFQTTVIVLGDDGISRSLLSNVPGVLTRGVEGDITIRPTSAFSFGGNFSYAPTKYIGFNAPCYSGQTVVATASKGACYTYGTSTAIDADGLPSIQAPAMTYTLNAAFNPKISEKLQVFSNVNFYHRSSAWSQAGNANTIVAGYGIVNGNIGIGRPDGSLKLSLYARNLFNKLYWSRYGTMTFAPAGSYLQYAASDAARTIGARLDYSF